MTVRLADVIDDEDDDYEEEDDMAVLGPTRAAMSKRTPSILVTDVRSAKPRSTAPFAGHAVGINVSKNKGSISSHINGGSSSNGMSINNHAITNGLRTKYGIKSSQNTIVSGGSNQAVWNRSGSSSRPTSVSQRITSSIKDKLKYSSISNRSNGNGTRISGSKYDPQLKPKNTNIPIGSTLTSNTANKRLSWRGGNPLDKNKDGYKIRRPSESSRFSDISMDNILLDSSSVPSGRREQRGSHSSWDRFPLQNMSHLQNHYNKYRKSINTLPSRTSKISQKLVLIPEDTELTTLTNFQRNNTTSNGLMLHGSGDILDRKNHSSTRAQLLNDNESYRYKDGRLPRLTAYNIADGFNIKLLTKFLKHTHEVSPRLYDDCLYVPYVLPLLPGKDGFRIKSNVSERIHGGKTLIEKLLDTSEQRDHHFEYYSGVEAINDVNQDIRGQSSYSNDLNNTEIDELGNKTNKTTTRNISDSMNNSIVGNNTSNSSRRSSMSSKKNDINIDNNIRGRQSSSNVKLSNRDQNGVIVREHINPSPKTNGYENVNHDKIMDNNKKVINSDDSFDPSEPQLFAEESPLEQEIREREELLKITSPLSTSPNLSRDPIGDEPPDKNTLSMFSNQHGSNNFDSNKNMDGNLLSNISEAETKRFINQNMYRHAELFIFHYGVIVFWNFTEDQEKDLLGDLAFADEKNLIIRPLDEPDIETEEFHFEYDKDTKRPRIFNDVITLRSGDHFIKLTLSYAIAQSTKLSRFESRISPILNSVMKLPKRLALHGTLGLKREQLLKKSGKLFKLRVDVNLSSNVLDTPDFFWSVEPSLHPLYIAMREYLEIDKRVTVVNDRCKVFLEFFDICVDSVAERNIARVTFWFIIMIVVGVIFSVTEVMVRYNIIHN